MLLLRLDGAGVYVPDHLETVEAVVAATLAGGINEFDPNRMEYEARLARLTRRAWTKYCIHSIEELTQLSNIPLALAEVLATLVANIEDPPAKKLYELSEILVKELPKFADALLGPQFEDPTSAELGELIDKTNSLSLVFAIYSSRSYGSRPWYAGLALLGQVNHAITRGHDPDEWWREQVDLLLRLNEEP